LVQHTLAAFAAIKSIHAMVLVVAPDDDFAATLPQSPLPCPPVQIVACGGASRAASVRNGLQALVQAGAQAHDWVLVHDAARCLLTPDQITQLIAACTDDPVGGLLAQPLADTLKSGVAGRVAHTLPRTDKWLAQTPQMFRLDLLTRALHSAGEHVTDESSAVEVLGLAPRLVPCSGQNFKVTYPEDFALAEMILRSRAAA
jgi:2-C-methyl-D-erythritol 4-phosphate cytidylyltransferase